MFSPDGKRVAFVDLFTGPGDTLHRVGSSVWSALAAGDRARRLVVLPPRRVEGDAFHLPELSWPRAAG